MSKDRPYYGSAVVDGKIRFLSVSQITLFDPAHEGCNRKWVFSYVFRKKLLRTDSQTGGADYAGNLEHYLKTGEDVLPSVLQEAKKYFPLPGPDLEVEEPLGIDFAAAVKLREGLFKAENYPGRDAIVKQMRQLAGLTACDIPLDGAADYRHRRGEFLDEEGVLYREHPSTNVVEIGDLKTTSRIWPHKVRSGENAGKIVPGFAKTAAQVCAHPQMVGYARHAIDRYPGISHVRLSHVYAQTSSRGATKRTGLISVEEVLRRWHGVENTVNKMTQVATAQHIEDVEPSPSSCDAYTHVVTGPDGKPLLNGNGKPVQAKGCGHRYYCPLSDSVIVQNMIAPYKESAMSLFDSIPVSALPSSPIVTPAPVATPTPDSERAVIEAEKARLLAEDVAPSAPTLVTPAGQQVAFVSKGCGAPGCGVGCQPGWFKSPTGGLGAFLQCQACRGSGKMIATMATTQPTPTAVTPPDAPPPAPILHAASPLPPVVVAEITDPALKSTVAAHAAQHQLLEQEKAAEEQAEKEAAGSTVWCSGGNKTFSLTMEMALSKKYTCPNCGKAIGLKPTKQPDGSFQASIGKHKPVNTPAASPPVPAPPPPPVETLVVAPPVPSVQVPVVEVPAVKTNGTNGTNGHHAFHVGTKDQSILTYLQSIDSTLRELVSLIREQGLRE